MDLGAHIIRNNEKIMSYINKHYDGIPRLRGVRFMKVEEPIEIDFESSYRQDKMFNSHCGEDVIYIHTRCGGGNYFDYDADKWEENNPLFINGIDDSFDCTYRDHYFNAVVDDEYNDLIYELLTVAI